jgi:hypothetical protein
MFATQLTTTRSFLRALFIAVGAVALVFGVGMTACLVATSTWSLDAWYAVDNGARPGAIIPHIFGAIGALVTTSPYTFAALITGVGAFAVAGTITVAPYIASAVSALFWEVRYARIRTARARECAAISLAVTR